MKSEHEPIWIRPLILPQRKRRRYRRNAPRKPLKDTPPVNPISEEPDESIRLALAKMSLRLTYIDFKRKRGDF